MSSGSKGKLNVVCNAALNKRLDLSRPKLAEKFKFKLHFVRIAFEENRWHPEVLAKLCSELGLRVSSVEDARKEYEFTVTGGSPWRAAPTGNTEVQPPVPATFVTALRRIADARDWADAESRLNCALRAVRADQNAFLVVVALYECSTLVRPAERWDERRAALFTALDNGLQLLLVGAGPNMYAEFEEDCPGTNNMEECRKNFELLQARYLQHQRAFGADNGRAPQPNQSSMRRLEVESFSWVGAEFITSIAGETTSSNPDTVILDRGGYLDGRIQLGNEKKKEKIFTALIRRVTLARSSPECRSEDRTFFANILNRMDPEFALDNTDKPKTSSGPKLNE